MPKSRKKKPDRRREIWAKSGGVCAHCGRAVDASHQTIDHFIPRSMDGGFDKRNLMPLCKKCNIDRMSEEIDPREYYLFAYEWAIDECLQYRDEWEEMRMDITGTIITP